MTPSPCRRAGAQPALEGLLGPWMETYDLLVHVPIVDQPSPDGIRALDPAFQRAVDRRLDQELERRGLPTLRLAAAERERWVDRVLEVVDEKIRPAQLELL